ncbi:DMT family transporter [Pikeienuella piscinae]|uniref:DMT family transporter n=1 Tax=Pikeienuella piscinae TaxID=2748098 RepID=A0A7L5BZT2_9RHOB|nr:DMT family transporter [Pikeienuella piscinae]QIE56991.1 DMT family transporter [Pikeienuella piscinae]
MSPRMAYLLCLVGVCGHASSEFVAKLADTPGPEFTVWRFMIGGAGLLVMTRFWPGNHDLVGPLRREGLRITLLSCLGMALGQLIFHWALDFTSVVQVATIVTAIPIFFVIFDRLINGAPLAPPKVVSGIGAFLAVILLMTNGAGLSTGPDDLIGTALALACGGLGGLYLVLAKPLVGRYGPVRMTAYTFVIGFFFLYVVVGSFWGTWVNPMSIFEKTGQQVAGILTIGLWNTAIAMSAWLAGLAAAPDGQRANYLFFLKPVIAAFLAVAILGDQLTLLQVLAILAICLCVGVEYLWTRARGGWRRSE